MGKGEGIDFSRETNFRCCVDVREEVEREREAEKYFVMCDIRDKYNHSIRRLTVFSCCLFILAFASFFMGFGLGFNKYENITVLTSISVLFYVSLAGFLLTLVMNFVTIIKRNIAVEKYKHQARKER
ncbi:MAG: hypothetical protein MJ245_06170 [Clostridia bacterium]|nr:hypothetical protein [Clostridia bacterium]